MILSLIVITICICFQAERGIFDFISYARLFRKLKQKNLNNGFQGKITLFILIPVLREQKIVEDTILKFCKIEHPNFVIKITMLTSAREQGGVGSRDEMTTEDVIVRSLNSGRLSVFKDRVLVFQDPLLNGNMATQLNYAINEIGKIATPNTFYLVYNADSIISETTFDRLSELLGRHADKEFAFQQPCAFVKDMHPSANRFTNAMSLYQSWYCLGHESRLLRNYDCRSEKWWGKKNGKLGVVVGHGSGMTLNINCSNGGYPSDLLTEDLTFGFILSTKNIPILSLPALEIADVPTRFSVFIKQKSVWFWNFLGYSSCYRKMRRQGCPRLKLLSLLMQGVGAGAYWFFDTFFILTPFFLSIILKSYFGIAIAVISFVAFYIIPQYFLLKKLPEVLENQGFAHVAENVRDVSFARLLPTLCLIILTNSVGAWIATCKSFNYFLTGKLPTKYKTGD
jgi:hypothetical protein